MKNKIKALSVGVLALGLSSIAQATVTATIEGINIYSTSVTGAVTNDFTGGCGYVSCTGDSTVADSLSNSGDLDQIGHSFGNYLSVPNPNSSGSVLLDTGNDQNYFGLFWGSIDSYNTISFLDNGVEFASFSGTDLASLIPNGNQSTWNSNRFVNFAFTGGDVYDTVKLASTQFAFETDNHATRVPEPGFLALFGLALAGLGFFRRRD
jgi:hypothetical protein